MFYGPLLNSACMPPLVASHCQLADRRILQFPFNCKKNRFEFWKYSGYQKKRQKRKKQSDDVKVEGVQLLL